MRLLVVTFACIILAATEAGASVYKGKVKEVESLINSKTNRILRNQLWGVILITLFTFFIFFIVLLRW